MILYFSAEGNSKAAALRLGELLEEHVQSITEYAPDGINFDGDTFGLVFPIYSWGVPPIVTDYVRRLNEKFLSVVRGRKSVWMICTCGDDVAMAPEMLKEALKDVGLELDGGWSLQMPNTYLLLPGFSLDSEELAHAKLSAAYPRLAGIAKKIRQKKWEEDYVRGGMPVLKSRLIFPLFKKFGVSPSRWHATDHCIGCGKCVDVCPVENISMQTMAIGHRPQWGKNCISCMGCYHHCPVNAVQYGNSTRGKGQYFFRHWPKK